MKNKYQKMNKSDLYFAVIQECRKNGLNLNEIDQKKSFLDNNSYQLISRDGLLIASIDLNELFFNGINSYGKSVAKTAIGCTGFAFIIIFLLSIMSVMFTDKPSSISSALKNTLANGIKECVVRDSENKTTKFYEVQSFSNSISRFKIQPIDPNSCFKVKAIPTDKRYTWFEIDLDIEKGSVSKTCGDSSKPGCEEGNTW